MKKLQQITFFIHRMNFYSILIPNDVEICGTGYDSVFRGPGSQQSPKKLQTFPTISRICQKYANIVATFYTNYIIPTISQILVS